MIRVLSVLVLISGLAAEGENEQGIFDCLTGPCVTVPGVGKLQGSKKSTQFTGRDVYGFWGIPFGESTAGENRFQPPKPRAPLNDGKDAFDASYSSYILSWFNKVCPQPGLNLGAEDTFTNPYFNWWDAEYPVNASQRGLLNVLGTEDCLHLAVFTPQLPTDNFNPKLPVMVYIHGGAFMLGGYIAAGPGKLLEKDVVLVEMQYRLGPLGFMCLPDDDIAGNMGLLDQQLALKWVREHISSFGGDPDHVTIFGESAGSASVTYHMISPLSQPYFEKAIAESGSALASWAYDSEAEKHAKEIATSLNCPVESTKDLVHCLRHEKTVQDIVIGHKKYYSNERAQGRLGFGGSSPCAQTHGPEKFITKHPILYLMDEITNEHTNIKPAMFGANKHEGSFVLGMMYNSYFVPNNILSDQFFLEYRFISTLLSAMGLLDESGTIYEMLEYVFFNPTDLGHWELMMNSMVNLVGTFFIKSSTFEFMKNNYLAGADSWFYSFEFYGEPSLWNFLFPGESPPIARGVTHGDELLYLFSTGVFSLTEEEWEMAWKMISLWTNFAIYGNPTAPENLIEGVPNWPKWTPQDSEYLVIDKIPRVATQYVETFSRPDRY